MAKTQSPKGMFNISTRVQYGFLALLALAEGSRTQPVRLGVIAKSLNISFKYLEHIFKLLTLGGIVSGTRGPEGGYMLKKDPAELSLYDIFSVLEGTLFTVECFDDESVCDHLAPCPVRDLWKEFNVVLADFLRARSLKDFKRSHKKSAVLAHAQARAVRP
jgi:Rrf2 family transcriptional regulator, cysteine metabolism repressor